METTMKKLTKNVDAISVSMCSPGPCTIKTSYMMCAPDEADGSDWSYCGPDTDGCTPSL